MFNILSLVQDPALDAFYAVLSEHWGADENSQLGLMEVSDDEAEDGAEAAPAPAVEASAEPPVEPALEDDAYSLNNLANPDKPVEDDLSTLPYPPSSIPEGAKCDKASVEWIQHRIDTLKSLG